MNEEEIRQMIAGMLAKGWNVELCDTPVPLYDNPVRAGIPTGVGSIMASDILLPKDMIKAGLDFMLPVHGDSMVDAGISDGDTLKVRLEKMPLCGDIVVASIDDEYTVKCYFESEDGRHWLVAQNEEKMHIYKPILLDDKTNVRIYGVVIEVVKQMPRASYRKLAQYVKKYDRKELPTGKQMVKVCEQTITEGLWWGNATWAVVFRVYQALEYKGSVSDFVRAVNGWPWRKELSFQCSDDSVGKPLRDGKLMSPIENWGKEGVMKRCCVLADRLLNLLNNR
ncbi:MAG: hypothetical protein IIZ88_07140 [Prevotella sp.]|nr:hypothetical protein [Prevotella sp.]